MSALKSALVWGLLVAIVAAAADLAGVAWLLLAVWLLFDMTDQALRDVHDVITAARERRRRRRRWRERVRRTAQLVNGEDLADDTALLSPTT